MAFESQKNSDYGKSSLATRWVSGRRWSVQTL